MLGQSFPWSWNTQLIGIIVRGGSAWHSKAARPTPTLSSVLHEDGTAVPVTGKCQSAGLGHSLRANGLVAQGSKVILIFCR